MILPLPMRNSQSPCAAQVHVNKEGEHVQLFYMHDWKECSNFLCFVTESCVCGTTGISVTFNSLSELGRRPIAQHVIIYFNLLELMSSTTSFQLYLKK